MQPPTMHMPHATSLRMGRLGYQSDAQSALSVSYNCLESYAASLERALTEPHADYAAIGIQNSDGSYRQLATSLLQIENEFYSTIRPKRVIQSGERPLHALRARGVEYVEVRCVDLDPFEPIGISAVMARFLDLFLMHCHLTPSPADSPAEIAVLLNNQALVSERGREPGLMLERNGEAVGILQWSNQLIDDMAPIAAAMAAATGEDYVAALQAMRHLLADSDRLPSARVLADIARAPAEAHIAVTRQQSERAREAVLALDWPDTADTAYRTMAATSIAAQQQVEAADAIPFEAFRLNYVSPERLRA